jgi:acetate---CoA ligase (ADP-forming)
MQFFFEPRSVVLIGVSRQSGPGAYNNLEMMLRYGYQGRIHLVHPKVPEILGHRTYPRVADLPEVPDLAVISVGRDRVLSVFADCAEKGIKRVIVISQGFADADDKGKALQKDLTHMAKKHGVRVVGPNTMGILNPFSSFSTAFVDIVKDASPPPLTIVVQSGVFQVGFESFTGRLGKAIDVGNCADVDFVDVIEYLESDPQTRIIVLHMEGMKRGREFLRVASRVSRKKPIIVLKTGRSFAGAKAALSHTGSLVGEDAVFDMVFARAGLIRVRNMVELHAVSKAFLEFGSMRGPRIGIVTATGACGIMTADACEDYGLEMAPFPEVIRSGLEDPHIAWHRLHNPVDLWPLGMVGGSFTDVLKRAVRGLIQDDQVDAVFGIVPALASPLHKDLDLSQTLREINLGNASHKPIALWLYGGDQAQMGEALEKEPHVACFESIDEAVMGLSAFWRHEKWKKDGRDTESLFGPLAGGDSRAVPLPPRSLLVGDSAQSLLRQYQIPMASGELVQDSRNALSAAHALGYPVVLKIISPEWLHKSDWGGIRLNVADDGELERAFAELKELFGQRTHGGALEGILVQKQLQGIELILGLKKDPEFGPVIVAGMGGIYTEVFKDVARSLAPIDRADAESMVRSLHLYPILKGIRGQKPARLSALIDAVLCLSGLAMDYPEISELDLNPVVLNEDGCWCVDCRLVTE